MDQENIDDLLKDDLDKYKPTKEELEEWNNKEIKTQFDSFKEKKKCCSKCMSNDLIFKEIDDFILKIKCNKCGYEETYIDDTQIL